MSTSFAIRDLRNDTLAVIRAMEAEGEVTITNRGRPVARLLPPASPEVDARVPGRKRRWMTKEELLNLREIGRDTGWFDQLMRERAEDRQNDANWRDPWT